ncbi:hypothetical protein [Altererythrobacter sp.]
MRRASALNAIHSAWAEGDHLSATLALASPTAYIIAIPGEPACG